MKQRKEKLINKEKGEKVRTNRKKKKKKTSNKSCLVSKLKDLGHSNTNTF
jgi:hypothetical protein